MRDRGERRPSILRSIRTRLAATFFLITLLAVAVIYVVVAPPLNSGLQAQKIRDLAKVANVQESRFKPTAELPLTDTPTKKMQAHAQSLALNASTASGRSFVTVIDVELNATGTTAPQPNPLASSPGAPTDQAIQQFAGTVAANGGTTTATLPGSSGPLGAVGFIAGQTNNLARVVVFTTPLNDVVGAVSLVRSRILLAAAIALVVALLTGALVARAITVRVLRLERVAQRVAQGDFDAHFQDSSGDELGRLASALAHMQSQLEGLEEARRRFIATASHELRTPIFSLGGFLELIQDEDLDEDTRRQFVGQVREQVERLGKLATQLLDLSRLESGSVQLSPAPTDLGVLARAVSAEFVPALAQNESTIELDVPDDTVRAVCDPERVAQLLRILIDNALIHTGTGTEVLVAVTPADRDAGAQMSVRDHGPGIPAEALGRIFEPFYRADAARGAGLGLAIAHELAAQMGARLEVSSVPGDTTFTLVLDANGN